VERCSPAPRSGTAVWVGARIDADELPERLSSSARRSRRQALPSSRPCPTRTKSLLAVHDAGLVDFLARLGELAGGGMPRRRARMTSSATSTRRPASSAVSTRTCRPRSRQRTGQWAFRHDDACGRGNVGRLHAPQSTSH
jgi:hypothetical protein